MNDLNAHIPTIGEIQSHASAQRYALALSGLAVAQERITALEKALEDAEWLRLQAESGGLDLAIETVIPGASLAWVADVEPGPCNVRRSAWRA